MSPASRKTLLPAVAAVAWLLAGHPVPATAQMTSREAISLQDQILELRQQLQSLRGAGGAPQSYAAQPAYPPPATGATADIVTQLLSRVNALEDQVRQLRGRVDELDNTVQRTTADLGKQIGDLKFQLQNPQAAQAGAAAAATLTTPPAAAARPTSAAAPPPPPPPPTPTAARPPTGPPTGPRTPEVALQEGYAALRRGDYVSAEHDAQEVLSKRASPRAYDAQYLLAQSLAGQHQWSRAAIAYDDTFNRSQKGAHADEALLGLANSLTQINEKRAACETLTKLHKQFPHTRPALRDQIKAAEQRAGCKA